MPAHNWRQALQRTRRAAFGRVAALLGATELDDAYWDDLLAGLIQADVGVGTAEDLVRQLQAAVKAQGWTTGDELQGELESLLRDRLKTSSRQIEGKPHVVLVVGVNGSGKTTTVARLAHREKAEGRSVVLAAADTYRAAAVEQLQRWGERLGCQVVHGEPGSDPGAVLYRACESAREEGIDVLIADTSGRMHTSHNLMGELAKLNRVAAKAVEGAPHEVVLVIDATTGQNGLSQARAFAETVPVTGVALAKLDTSARGGVAFGVAGDLGLPLQFAGVGESIEDLEPFDPAAFVSGLLATAEPFRSN